MAFTIITGIIVPLLISAELAFACYPSKKADFNPKTSEELKAAITKSKSGNVIELLPQDYEGDFQLTDSKSVTIKGTNTNSKSTTIISRGTAFDIQGNGWAIQSLAIKGASTGIKVQGNKNGISGIAMNDVGQGVVLVGDENTVKGTTIKGTSPSGDSNGRRNTRSNQNIQSYSDNDREFGSANQQVQSTGIRHHGNNNKASDPRGRVFNFDENAPMQTGREFNFDTLERQGNGVQTALVGQGESLGIKIQGSKNEVSGVTMRDVGEGVVISGDGNKVIKSAIKTNVMGINIRSGNGNKIESSSFSGSTPSLSISKGTSGGSITSNAFQGSVTINGEGYEFTSNAASGGTTIQGCKNKLKKNAIANANINRECNEVDASNSFYPKN